MSNEFLSKQPYFDLSFKTNRGETSSLNCIFNSLRSCGIICLSDSVLYRVLLVIANKRLFSTPLTFNILASSHGVYGHDNAFILSLCYHFKRKIAFLQPGFIHSQAQYIHQVRYEQKLSTAYFTWGGKMNNKCFPVGCPYTHNSSSFHEEPLFILPQVPGRVPRPFSYYWSHINDFIRIKDSFLVKLKALLLDHSNLVVRCKSCDYPFYNSLFDFHDISCHLQSGDVNNEDICNSHSFTYVTYLSTAIPECFYKNSNVQLLMSPLDFQLDREPQTILSNIVNSECTSQSQLSSYLNKYSSPATPAEISLNILDTLHSL